MHRFRTVVAGALASAMTLVTCEVAWASSPRAAVQSSSDFCATAQRLQTEIQDLRDLDIGSLTLSRAKSKYRRFVRLIKQLQKEPPSELKPEFRRLRRLYQRVADGKLELKNLPDAISTAADDLSTVFDYLENQCGITFENTTTTT
jgi:hypothetical protein